LAIQLLKSFQLQGGFAPLTPNQGLCPWTPLGALPPHHRFIPLPRLKYKCLPVAEMDHRLVTIDMRRKEGGCIRLVGAGQLDSHPTHRGLGRGLPPYQVASWSIQHLATTDMGWKLEAVPFGGGTDRVPI